MMNSDSCGNETPTDDTTNDLDVSGISDAAKILIERMKIKPEEFEPGGKFGSLRRTCLQRLSPDPMLADSGFPVPLRDVHVLLAACEKYIVEPAFTKHVLETVFAEPKPEPAQQAYVRPGIGGLGLKYTDPRGVYGNALSVAIGTTDNAAGWGQSLTASTSVQANSIQVGQQVLNESLIQKMREKLGL